jgi:hypothetical protein
MDKQKFARPLIACCLLVAMAGIWGQASTDNWLKLDSGSFKTPEAAIQHFLGGISHSDLATALQACAISDYASGFDFSGYAKRIGQIAFPTSLAPAGTEWWDDINTIDRLWAITRQIKFFCYSLLSSEKVISPLPKPSDERLAQFISETKPEHLTGIEVLRTSFPQKRYENNEDLLALARQQAQNYGASDSTERLVLFRFDGELWVAGFHLLRYGQNWLIDNLSSYLANTAANGMAKRISELDFDALINSP